MEPGKKLSRIENWRKKENEKQKLISKVYYSKYSEHIIERVKKHIVACLSKIKIALLQQGSKLKKKNKKNQRKALFIKKKTADEMKKEMSRV